MNARPPLHVVQARQREIQLRYAAASRKRGYDHYRPIAAVRAAELMRVYEHRYGKRRVPETEDGLMAARLMCHHLGHLKDPQRRITQWLTIHAPWLDIPSCERLMCDCVERPLRFKSQTLAWKLRVTAQERASLRLTTIGAIDETPDARQAKRRHAMREYSKQQRVKAGSVPRAQSISQAKPWQQLGISRASWYRRQPS